MKNVPVTKGETVQLTIEDLAYGGDSVGRYKNFAIFLPYGIPGQTLTAEITRVKSNFALAEIRDVIKESPDFTIPPCPLFRRCGGCDWMNIRYPVQLAYKKKFVDRMMEKEAGLPAKYPGEPVSCDEPLYYRDRGQFKLSFGRGRVRCGFYQKGTRQVVDVEHCSIMREKINEVMAAVRGELDAGKGRLSIYDEKNGRGCLRHVCVRVNGKNEALLTFVAAREETTGRIKGMAESLFESVPGMRGVTINNNRGRGNRVFGDRETALVGDDFITESLRGVDFILHSSSFFQINLPMLNRMLDFIEKKMKPGGNLLDLYGGVGALSLPFHREFKKVSVVEINSTSAAGLKSIARHNRIDNLQVIEGNADREAGDILMKESFDTVIIDPPRKGGSKTVIDALVKHGPEKLIYISCDPMTLGRDLKRLLEAYRPLEISPLDLFPQTYHVETMAALERK